MSLTFYYAPMSTATITELVLEELGVPCERVKLDLQKGESHTPEYLKVNPNGKVPAIVHDGSPIFESAAITLYLGETFGVERRLYPPPGPRRGEAMKWVVWANVTVGDAAARWMRNTLERTPADQRNAKAGEVGLRDLASCLRILDEHLEGREFLVGGYTLADTHLHSFLDWLRHMRVDFSPYARVNAWSGRCAARPAYMKVMFGGNG